jgi:DNA polymerase-3 subunit epsilon
MELLFLDTETGGLNPYQHSLLQVGVVAYKGGEIVDSLSFEVKHDQYYVTEQAMKINGLDLTEIDKTGMRKDQAVVKLNEFISKNFLKQPNLAGHNPSIDKYMVRNQLYESNNLNMDQFISHRMIDTMSIIWALHHAGELPIEACSSTGAFEYFGITVEKRHNALDDIIATVKLYECLLKEISK